MIFFFETPNGEYKYEVSFVGGDIVWMKTTTIEDWGNSYISFGRKIKNNQVVWQENDHQDPLLHVIPEFQTYVNKLVKLRAFL